VTLVEFHGSLETAIQLVQSCSLFIGMHGAVCALTANLHVLFAWLVARAISTIQSIRTFPEVTSIFSPNSLDIHGREGDTTHGKNISCEGREDWLFPDPHGIARAIIILENVLPLLRKANITKPDAVRSKTLKECSPCRG
jgi:hypothetical protein